MAKYISKDVRIFFENLELGTATTNISVGMQTLGVEKTSFTEDGDTYVAGIRQDAIEWSGLFDDSISMDKSIGSLVGSGTKVFSVFIGSGIGSVAFAGLSHNFMARPTISLRDLVGVDAAFQPEGTLSEGVILIPKTTTAAGMNFGSLNQVSTTTAGGHLYSHVLTASGSLTTGTVTIIMQEGPDGAAWATFLSNVHTALGGVGSSTTTGTVEQWVRGQYASSTAGTATFLAVWSRG